MKELYSTKDVKEVRIKLLQEQDGKDLLTGLPLASKDAVCDHDHDTQFVRGILHRQSNAVLGKIENLWARYLGWWYNGTLPEFLRKAADYLERPIDKRYVHPKWISKLSVQFSKLQASRQSEVISSMTSEVVASSAVKRRLQFEALLKSRRFTFDKVKDLLQ